MIAELDIRPPIMPENPNKSPTLFSQTILSPLFLGNTLTRTDLSSVFKGREASPETEVVLEAKSGNTEAQACIYVAYHDRVALYLFNKTSSKPTAEDLTSITMEGVRAGVPAFEFRPDASFYSWVFRIAFNNMSSYYRSKRREHKYGLEAAGTRTFHEHQTAIHKNDLEEHVLNSVLYDSAVEKLSALPQRQRLVVSLRFVKGLTIEKTAAEMVTTIGNVKALQHKGISRLKKLMIDPSLIKESQTPPLGNAEKSA